MWKITTSSKTPDEQQLKKVNDVVARLIDEHGYNSTSANELLRYVGSLLNRSMIDRIGKRDHLNQNGWFLFFCWRNIILNCDISLTLGSSPYGIMFLLEIGLLKYVSDFYWLHRK